MKTSLAVSMVFALSVGRAFVAQCDEVAGLKLRLSVTRTTWKMSETPRLKVSIQNNSLEPVTLVHPGDGSESGWRTPIINWSVLPTASRKKHSNQAVPLSIPRCGNMNPFDASEMFSLAPGQTKTWNTWISHSPFLNLKPGRYRVVFLYANRPDLQWRNEQENDPLLMEQVRNSRECSLKSNEITLLITK